jgi:glutamine synthetase
MRRSDVLFELLGYLEGLGWSPYQCDHEDANGQFEINFKYDEALKTADHLAFYKFMVRSVAEKHGLRATFMAKPFTEKTGNGQHCHFTLHDKATGSNLFEDKAAGDEYGLSPLANNFLGGVLQHIKAITALVCPTVNSYKRLFVANPHSGATWAPTKATHGGNDRTHTVRVPDAPRFELRLGDMSANPYLMGAAILAAGLDGIAKKADPGPRSKVPASQVPEVEDRKLPTNLLDALRAYDADTTLKAALGSEFSAAHTKLRTNQWGEYVAHLSEWELDTYFDI